MIVICYLYGWKVSILLSVLSYYFWAQTKLMSNNIHIQYAHIPHLPAYVCVYLILHRIIIRHAEQIITNNINKMKAKTKLFRNFVYFIYYFGLLLFSEAFSETGEEFLYFLYSVVLSLFCLRSFLFLSPYFFLSLVTIVHIVLKW